ncbi:MAG: hypothetical protein EPN25_15405 [Nitrospirae bacterium]|nr:MAG: hypothetical protein EPN25_15405 [Nitrospirota bacterium]
MSMYEVRERLRKDFSEAFPDGLTNRQLWFIAKLGKAIRVYCRNNTSFNNFMNDVFSGLAVFEQVTKTKPSGETYPGLKITVKNKDNTESTAVYNQVSEKGDDEK